MINGIFIILSIFALIFSLVAMAIAEENSSIISSRIALLLLFSGIIFIAIGLIYGDGYVSEMRGRCRSMGGEYANEKCFKDGKEV